MTSSSSRRPKNGAGSAKAGGTAGAERVSSGIGLAPRAVAARVWFQVMERGQMLDVALAHEERRLQALSPRDRALAERIVRTALRRHGQIADALNRFLKRPLPRKAGHVRAVLHTAAAQILFMRVAEHAAIDIAVTLTRREAKSRHMAGLVNAVLRNLARQAAEILAKQDAFVLDVPAWARRQWIADWGETTARAMAATLRAEPPLDLTLKNPDEAAEWARRLHGLALPTGGVRIARPEAPVPRLPGYAEGAWWVQDAAASLPVRLLDDIRGLRVLDLCAAPGGKTAQLAAAGARVTALDASSARLARLRENLARLDLRAEIVCADALTWRPPEPFDAVLLDAPCTATGTARRHPEVLWLKTADQQAALVDLQRRMLRAALAMVRPGGALVYCVCSLQKAEGEAQIARLVEHDPEAVRVTPATPAMVADQAHLLTPEGYLRTLPHQTIGAAETLDGFFAARLVRTA